MEVSNVVSTVPRIHRYVLALVLRIDRLCTEVYSINYSIEVLNLTYRGVCAPSAEMGIQKCPLNPQALIHELSILCKTSSTALQSEGLSESR